MPTATESTPRESRAPYDHNTATLPKELTENARNHASDKEEVESRRLMVFDRSKRVHGDRYRTGFETPITARFWMGRSSSASVVYCSIWINTRDGRSFSGRGSAGGCGYHKMSAALDDAISNAGIKLAVSCGGGGDGPMDLAIQAIGRAAGYGRLPSTVVQS